MMLRQVLLPMLFFFLLPACITAQQTDSLRLQVDTASQKTTNHGTDSIHNITNTAQAKDTIVMAGETALQKLLKKNGYLNSTGKPVSFIERERKVVSKNILFYSLALLVFIFALLKFMYARYFANMFRVFFNTSLRQGQLTDQLLQAKLPSMLFNLFFVLIGGWYIYLLLNYFGKIAAYSQWQAISICAAGLMLIYLGKFLTLKFTGWITGYRQEADTYIFIVFLINKIVAVCLIPIVVIIAFSEKQLVHIALIVSFVMIGIMLLMRFFRSYSLLQNRLKVGRFHFFVYITGIEIIPLIVIYKLALLFMSKKL
jgi:Domain of unknown function (DUF4271)